MNVFDRLKNQKAVLDARIAAVTEQNQERQDALTAPAFYPGGDSAEPTASTLDLSGRNNMSKHPMNYLMQQSTMLENNLNKLTDVMEREAALLKQEESRRNGNIVGGSPQGLKHDFSNLSPYLRPGNLGDINKIVWPFWFTSSKVTLAPNTAAQGNITITQEAAFIWLSYVKCVFLEEDGGPGQYQYIDPDAAGAAGKQNGLTLLIRDSQSSRQFMNQPIDINQVGHWRYPTVLPTPQLLLPNTNLELSFQNNTNDLTYRPFVTLFGLRVRIEDAKNILSTISG